MDFESQLESVAKRRLRGCTQLISAERLSGGAAQETYRLTLLIDGLEKVLALRRAHGGLYVTATEGHPGLQAEALLMQSARAVSVPAPQVHYVLTPEDDLGDGFFMEWIEGEALGARIVRSDTYAELRPRLARECGRILAKIHRIDLDATGLRERLSVVTPRRFVERMWDLYREMETPQPMIDYTACWLLEHLPDEVEMTLVHSEFRVGNFMVSPTDVVAVLDWEEAHIGDPMRDLGWLCTNSWRFGAEAPVGGFGTFEELFAGYEEISGKPVDMAHVHFWEVFGSYWWAVIALSLAKQEAGAETPLLERTSIGRRTTEAQVDCVNLLIPGPLAADPAEVDTGLFDTPSAAFLLKSVSQYLRTDVMQETSGRSNFLARVAATSADIITRELTDGPLARGREICGLQRVLSRTDENLIELRRALVDELRVGGMDLNNESLTTHLRNSIVDQARINQPGYSGVLTALANGHESAAGDEPPSGGRPQ